MNTKKMLVTHMYISVATFSKTKYHIMYIFTHTHITLVLWVDETINNI